MLIKTANIENGQNSERNSTPYAQHNAHNNWKRYNNWTGKFYTVVCLGERMLKRGEFDRALCLAPAGEVTDTPPVLMFSAVARAAPGDIAVLLKAAGFVLTGADTKSTFAATVSRRGDCEVTTLFSIAARMLSLVDMTCWLGPPALASAVPNLSDAVPPLPKGLGMELAAVAGTVRPSSVTFTAYEDFRVTAGRSSPK